jgi:RimJ/RimL family protein N-acetyltransferase
MATSNGQHFPKDVKLRDGRTATLRLMGSNDKQRVLDFARALPQDDLLFLRTDITDPEIVEDWIKNVEKGTTITILSEINGDLTAYASLHLNEARWTRRVGEIRVNTGFAYRNTGLGRRLVSEIFEIGRGHGLKKMTAMMTPDQTGARAVFEKIGFQVEAILADWVEDRRGQPRDLLVMSHDLDGFSDHVTA